MNILFLSKEGNGMDLAWKMTQEGHSVIMWIRDPKYRKIGNGFVKKTENFNPLKKSSQLIIFDDSELGEASESLRKEGFTVWGGNRWSDEIESDRGKGQETLKSIGMKIIPSHDFTDLEKGLEFVRTHPGRYVVKPSGPIQDEKSLTYVGKDENGSDLISVLENYKSKWASRIDKFELQEVKVGVEVAVGGLFNGKDFCEPILVNFEHKKLMPGNIGPATGEMGTSGVWMPKNKIYRESIGRMVPLLRENKYVGYLDINCIAERDTLWPLEFTSRFGYPTLNLKLETMKGDLGKLFYGIAKGQVSSFQISNPYILCVVLASPPFPFEAEELHKKYSEEQEIVFSGKNKTGYWPGEVLNESGKWFLTGDAGYDLVCTGQGKSLNQARGMAYERVNRVTIPHSFYRNDIGSRTEENLRTLNLFGWFS